jgi:hypothetical protein
LVGEIAREKQIPLLTAGGTANHLHLPYLVAANHHAGEGGAGTQGEHLAMAQLKQFHS